MYEKNNNFVGKMEILVIEDNRRISDFLVRGLEESGFLVALADNGVDARNMISLKDWDLILLDIMLPDIDGFELLRYMRFKKINTPVLVLSALSTPDDKVKALNIGADDYLAKPFHFKELIARINALLRRSRREYSRPESILCCDNLEMNVDRHLVTRAGVEIKLTTQEFLLLKLLMENKNMVLTRTQILNAVWGIGFNTNTNIVDVYISYLRSKIESGNEKLIETIKNRGYLIRTKE